MRCIATVLVLGLLALPAAAAPSLDGTLDASYGGVLPVPGNPSGAQQLVETGFGNASPPGSLGGSELDGAYGQVSGGVLYLMLTGNLENNFNKLEVFIDSGLAGGQNQLQADANSGGNNPTNDGWANKYAGFMFDSGFAANYMLILRDGNFGGDRFDIDYAVVGGGAGNFLSASSVFGASLTGSNAAALPNGIGVAYNNSNALGVGGNSPNAAAAGAGLTATTGIELAIPLAAIGNPSLANVKVSAMINGSNHDYLSNQFLGSLTPPQGNLGGDGAGNFTGTVGAINLKQFAGNQYFTLVPEPSSMVLAGLALVGLVAVARRK
jgi:PEP-CTERM motif